MVDPETRTHQMCFLMILFHNSSQIKDESKKSLSLMFFSCSGVLDNIGFPKNESL